MILHIIMQEQEKIRAEIDALDKELPLCETYEEIEAHKRKFYIAKGKNEELGVIINKLAPLYGKELKL